jgi:hypothetical protein
MDEINRSGWRGWRKSSRSGSQGNCVEVRIVDGGVEVRDSKDPTGPVLTFTRAEWAAFLAGAKGDEFDLG